MNKKYSLTYIRQLFNNINYTLLSVAYINNKLPLYYMCNNFHYSSISLQRFLKGQRCRKCFNTDYSKRRRLFDDTVFDNIMVREAYFLGFLFADGSLSINKNSYRVQMSSADKDIIDNCKEFFNSKNKICHFSRNGGRTLYMLSLASEKLFNALNSLGCTPNKSLIVDEPKIDRCLYYPFIMGLFDGDGSISINKNKTTCSVEIVTGSYKLCLWLTTFLSKEKLIFYTNISTKKSDAIYKVHFKGLSARVFLDRIYNSISGYVIPMQRKKNLYDRIVNIKFRQGPKLQQWELDYINSSLPIKMVVDLINNDDRIYWYRPKDTIYRARRRAFLL